MKGKELPTKKHLKEVVKSNRKSGNLAEIIMWKKLRNKQFHGLDFDRQRNIGNLAVDFYCPEKRAIIEVDGSSHKGKENYDKARDEYFKSLDLKIIHLTDFDVKTNMSAVIKRLETLLLESP